MRLRFWFNQMKLWFCRGVGPGCFGSWTHVSGRYVCGAILVVLAFHREQEVRVIFSSFKSFSLLVCLVGWLWSFAMPLVVLALTMLSIALLKDCRKI